MKTECRIYNEDEVKTRKLYFDLSESLGIIFVNAFDEHGDFVATVAAISEEGLALSLGLPHNFGIPMDKKGRIMLINDDLKVVQTTTKRDLPLERIE